MYKFYHLVDHPPPGSILYLLEPLQSYNEHVVFTSFESVYQISNEKLEIIRRDNCSNVVIHSTGRNYHFFEYAKKYLSIGRYSFVFMHVSPLYLRMRKREYAIKKLRELQNLYGTIILTPSKQIAKNFIQEGLKAYPIQIGIKVNEQQNPSFLTQERDKILTTCTDASEDYQYIKGIDYFIELIKKNNLQSSAIIVGYDGQDYDGIKRVRFSYEDFQNCLSKAKVYIQLSRTEAYNLTAIEAKRLKVPVIVSNIEGHKDNIRYGFRVNNLIEASECLNKILQCKRMKTLNNMLNNNFVDSHTRESLDSFAKSFYFMKKLTKK